MDTSQWPQEIVVKPMDEIIVPNTNASKPNNNSVVERKVRPQKDQALNCPRCNSTNTKFCYYNNYSLSQPRYFCKTCRRYWTEGGSLRNIPVGGGSRKNKRSSSNSNSSYSNIIVNNNNLKKLPDLVPPPIPPTHHDHLQNPSKILEGSQDLNLGFSSDFKTITELIQVPNYDGNNNNNDNNNSSSISPLPSSSSSMELINGIPASTRGLNNNNNNSFMSLMPNNQDPNSVYNSSSGSFSLMPSLNFSLDHHHHHALGNNNNNNNHFQEETNTNGRFLFPFVGLKHVSTTNDLDHDHDHDHNIKDHHQPAGDQSTYWNGMIGGGGGSW